MRFINKIDAGELFRMVVLRNETADVLIFHHGITSPFIIQYVRMKRKQKKENREKNHKKNHKIAAHLLDARR